jgi:hypothetical protein
VVCSCGIPFENFLTKDIYDISVDRLVNEAFGDGFSLFYVSLKEQGVSGFIVLMKDLYMSKWELFGELSTRKVSYTIKQRKNLCNS